jgi:hypothetical protein
MLAYVFPGLSAIVINYKRGECYMKSLKAILIFLIGFVAFISGAISISHKITNGYDCSHGKEMNYCKIKSSNHTFSITYEFF